MADRAARYPGDGRVLAIGLDGFEISYAERLMEAGAMPVLASMRDRSARVLLDHGPAVRTGLAWEHFWSGLSPERSGRPSVVEFEPDRYSVWQGGARFEPFFSSLEVQAVVFDPPYASLRHAPRTEGVVGWGAHDPGVDSTETNPPALLADLRAAIGPYPSGESHYAIPWSSPDATRAMARGLVAGLAARTEAARWLLTQRVPDWDLAIVAASEPHSAAEGLWHGIDECHPLHGHPSAEAAAEGMTEVYRATDRMVGELVTAAAAAATAPTVVVFSLGGMGTNGSDVPSMGLLPELLYRWSFGEPLLTVPIEWSAAPREVPLATGGGTSGWQREWFRHRDVVETPSRVRALTRRLPAPVRGSLRRLRTAVMDRGQPTGFANLDWHPATWYRPWWPRMRAFALPSFSPGRIRVNLRGRERDGIVDAADYDTVCDDIERVVRATRDPRTGEPVAKAVERRDRGSDPYRLSGTEADVVVAWQGSAVAFYHDDLGLIGPLPYRRTGGHSGPFGFAYFDGAGLAPCDHGVASTFDLAPTLAGLVSNRPVSGISGTGIDLRTER